MKSLWFWFGLLALAGVVVADAPDSFTVGDGYSWLIQVFGGMLLGNVSAGSLFLVFLSILLVGGLAVFVLGVPALFVLFLAWRLLS